MQKACVLGKYQSTSELLLTLISSFLCGVFVCFYLIRSVLPDEAAGACSHTGFSAEIPRCFRPGRGVLLTLSHLHLGGGSSSFVVFASFHDINTPRCGQF